MVQSMKRDDIPVGPDADLTIVDFDQDFTIRKQNLHSKRLSGDEQSWKMDN